MRAAFISGVMTLLDGIEDDGWDGTGEDCPTAGTGVEGVVVEGGGGYCGGRQGLEYQSVKRLVDGLANADSLVFSDSSGDIQNIDSEY